MDWSLLGFQGLSQLFNTHPVFVHFPIALFPTAFLFYLIGVLRKRKDMLLSGQICLALGLISTIVTVLTGYWAQETFPHGDVIHRMMETHQTLGFAILGLGLLLTIWSFLKREGAPRGSIVFMALLGITVLVIFQNGDLGARMVFVEGAAVKAVPTQPEAETLPEQGAPAPENKPEMKKDSHDHHGHDHHH